MHVIPTELATWVTDAIQLACIVAPTPQLQPTVSAYLLPCAMSIRVNGFFFSACPNGGQSFGACAANNVCTTAGTICVSGTCCLTATGNYGR